MVSPDKNVSTSSCTPSDFCRRRIGSRSRGRRAGKCAWHGAWRPPRLPPTDEVPLGPTPSPLPSGISEVVPSAETLLACGAVQLACSGSQLAIEQQKKPVHGSITALRLPRRCSNLRHLEHWSHCTHPETSPVSLSPRRLERDRIERLSRPLPRWRCAELLAAARPRCRSCRWGSWRASFLPRVQPWFERFFFCPWNAPLPCRSSRSRLRFSSARACRRPQ